MFTSRGIAMTDGLNRKNHQIPLEKIIISYEQNWKIGVPRNLNHDNTNFIGWTFLKGIYIEPGRAYLINTIQTPENDTEYQNLFYRNSEYLNEKYYVERKDKYDELKELLGENLSAEANPVPINCVAYEDKDILFKVFPELKDKMNKGLINIKELTPLLPGVYKKDKYVIFAHRYFRRNCSMLNSFNDDFLKRLHSLTDAKLDVQIALDQDLIGLLGTEAFEAEYQFWWGPKFNEDLSAIPFGVTRHGNPDEDKIFSNIRFTEFGWYKQDNRQTFECEEVIDNVNVKNCDNDYYGCRFVHSMLNPLSGLPNHLDGAIRAYTDEQILERFEISIDKSERNTWYTKLWRIDNDISVSLWKELITHYYRDNRYIGEYFSGKDEKFENILLEEKKEIELTTLEKYIPCNMNKGDGIRFYFSYLSKIDITEDYDVIIRSNEFLINNETKIKTKVMEMETISVLKLLLRKGTKAKIPLTSRVKYEDLVCNFPTFVCKNYEIAATVQDAIYELCMAWNSNNEDRLISYTIVTNNENDEAIKLSFAGHVNDIVSIFNNKVSRFPNNQNLFRWIDDLYKKNNKNGEANQYPKVDDLLDYDEVLRYKRKPVPPNKIANTKVVVQKPKVKLIEKMKTISEMSENQIDVTPLTIINKSQCSKCGKDYILCNCIKFIDDCNEIITDFDFSGTYYWTNRHTNKQHI